MPFTWAFYCHLWRRLGLLLWVCSPFLVDLSLLLLNFKQKIRNMWPLDTWVICYDDFWSFRLLHRYSRAIMIIENQMEFFSWFFCFANLYRSRTYLSWNRESKKTVNKNQVYSRGVNWSIASICCSFQSFKCISACSLLGKCTETAPLKKVNGNTREFSVDLHKIFTFEFVLKINYSLHSSSSTVYLHVHQCAATQWQEAPCLVTQKTTTSLIYIYTFSTFWLR